MGDRIGVLLSGRNDAAQPKAAEALVTCARKAICRSRAVDGLASPRALSLNYIAPPPSSAFGGKAMTPRMAKSSIPL